jgi:hypothetical protein
MTRLDLTATVETLTPKLKCKRFLKRLVLATRIGLIGTGMGGCVSRYPKPRRV